MNIIILLLAIYLMFSSSKTIGQTHQNLFIGGAASGFIAGIAGTGGAIRGLTLAAFQLPKEIFIATSALIDLGVDSSWAIVYLSSGYFDPSHWILIPFLIIISFLGRYTGKLILNHTFEKAFRYIVLGVIFGTAIYQIVKQVL